MNSAELFGGYPKPHYIRNLILKSQLVEPVVFKQIHSDWIPVKWDLDKFGSLFGNEAQLLSCRTGNISQEIQWERKTGLKCLSWNSICNWSSTDEWIYYDYKNMTDVIDSQYLVDFEWSKLGFPERHGEVSNLWVGSTGSYTPCHFDTYGCNLVSQVRGHKRWLLFPPEETSKLRPTRVPYEESSVYSEVNFDRPSHSDMNDLAKIGGKCVVLEPGDVLFVPPKWWHFVQSQDFSISVNTWIELPGDREMRLGEGIMRAVVASFVSITSLQTTAQLLNPNEEALLEASEQDIETFLESSTKDFLKFKFDNHTNIDEPVAKKTKLSTSDESIETEDKLYNQYPNVMTLKPFDLRSFYADNSQPIKSGDNNQLRNESQTLPTQQNSYIVNLINAIGHPSVVTEIMKRFLANVHAQSVNSINKR